MHSSSARIGLKFLEYYATSEPRSVLEIGSLDVNGSLRSFATFDTEWTGVDLESGPGVDLVVEPHRPLPLADDSFDLVVSTSVFEHDLAFWKTLAEMARVVKRDGYIYINAPSNGNVHRYPMDAFRFYPDASISFRQIVRESGKPSAFLAESFVASQDMPDGIWNDFVVVIGSSGECKKPSRKLYTTEEAKNIWDSDRFLDSSFEEITEDQAKHMAKGQFVACLEDRTQSLENELSQIKNSLSWKLTLPFRVFFGGLRP